MGGCRYKWRHFSLHSSLISVKPGQPQTIQVLNTTVPIRIPSQVICPHAQPAPVLAAERLVSATVSSIQYLGAQGEGIAGVLIADPCIKGASITSAVACEYADAFHVRDTRILCRCLSRKDTILLCRCLSRKGYYNTMPMPFT